MKYLKILLILGIPFGFSVMVLGMVMSGLKFLDDKVDWFISMPLGIGICGLSVMALLIIPEIEKILKNK